MKAEIPDKFLPLGTVVLLKNATKKLFITGFCPSVVENGAKVYDYYGCIYPEGLLSLKHIFTFNHSDIKEVFQLGFDNNENKKWMGNLKNAVSNLVDSNGNLSISDEQLKDIINAQGGENE